jgi:purine-cytosine permease-like protein
MPELQETPEGRELEDGCRVESTRAGGILLEKEPMSMWQRLRLSIKTPVDYERHGIESISASDRTASVGDFLKIELGGLNSLATAVLGAFPIILGLSFLQGLCAVVVGVFLGGLILAPMGIFSPISGTNNAVSSSAHFGVVGRIVGSFLSLLTAITFFSISVWSSGDAVVSAGHRAFGMTESSLAISVTYSFFILAVIFVCVYGFKLMLAVNKVAVVAASLLFVVGFAALIPKFNASYAGAGLHPGRPGFAPAFLSAVLISMSNPISCGAFLGDWSRYLPKAVSKVKVMLASVLAQLLSIGAFAFGLMATTIIAQKAPRYFEAANFTGGLISVAPAWLCGPLLVLAVLSGMSTGTTSLYGTGLDFSSIFPGLSRPRATLAIGTISAVLIYVGRFYFSLIDSITTFASLIVVATTPWMVIMILGYVNRRGHYLPEAMQVFNRGLKGGEYWFSGGWNIAGCSTWFISSACALEMVNIPGHVIGPLSHLVGDVDISIVVAIVLPALLYPILLFVFPEPGDAYGPGGARFSRIAHRLSAPVSSARGR